MGLDLIIFITLHKKICKKERNEKEIENKKKYKRRKDVKIGEEIRGGKGRRQREGGKI
jgi:hypothetical protein